MINFEDLPPQNQIEYLNKAAKFIAQGYVEGDIEEIAERIYNAEHSLDGNLTFTK